MEGPSRRAAETTRIAFSPALSPEEEDDDDAERFEDILRKGQRAISSLNVLKDSPGNGNHETAGVRVVDSKFQTAIKRWQLQRNGGENPNKENIVQVNRIAKVQQTILKKSFSRWKEMHENVQRIYQAELAVLNRRMRELFGFWRNLFLARGMCRVRILRRCLDSWVSFALQERKYTQLCILGETYFELVSKRQCLARMKKNLLSRKQRNLRERATSNKLRQLKLSRTISEWNLHTKRQAKNCEIQEKGRILFRISQLQFGFMILQRHARISIAATYVKNQALWRTAGNALRHWRERTREVLQIQLKLQGAAIVHDFALCRNSFEEWVEFVSIQKLGVLLKQELERRRLAIALFCFRRHAKCQKIEKMHLIRARSLHERRLTTVAFSWLRIVADAKVLNVEAVALRDVQLLRKFFLEFREGCWVARIEELARSAWTERALRKGFRAILHAWSSKINAQSGKNLALVFRQRKLISYMWKTWIREVLDSKEDKIYDRAAFVFKVEKLQEKTFKAWKALAFEKHNLSLSYKALRDFKFLRVVIDEWHNYTLRWVHYMSVLKKSRRARFFQKWREFASKACLERQALTVAAMHRRERLLDSPFQFWAERVQEKRFQRQVQKMAIIHAEKSLQCKSFQRWRKSYCWKVDIFQNYVQKRTLRRCLREWHHQTSKLKRKKRRGKP